MSMIPRLLFLLLVFPALLPAQQIIPLYENNTVPNSVGTVTMPTLTVYQPKKDLSKGTAVIVCSGGSYAGRANNVEGIPACKKLMEARDHRLPAGLSGPECKRDDRQIHRAPDGCAKGYSVCPANMPGNFTLKKIRSASWDFQPVATWFPLPRHIFQRTILIIRSTQA